MRQSPFDQSIKNQWNNNSLMIFNQRKQLNRWNNDLDWSPLTHIWIRRAVQRSKVAGHEAKVIWVVCCYVEKIDPSVRQTISHRPRSKKERWISIALDFALFIGGAGKIKKEHGIRMLIAKSEFLSWRGVGDVSGDAVSKWGLFANFSILSRYRLW